MNQLDVCAHMEGPQEQHSEESKLLETCYMMQVLNKTQNIQYKSMVTPSFRDCPWGGDWRDTKGSSTASTMLCFPKKENI